MLTRKKLLAGGLAVLVMLLLFILSNCSNVMKKQDKNITGKEKIVEKLKDCDFPKDNLSRIQRVLRNSDICDETWLNTLDELIIYLDQQYSYMKKNSTKFSTLMDAQKGITDACKQLRKEPIVKHVNSLKEAYMKYEEKVSEYVRGCKQ